MVDKADILRIAEQFRHEQCGAAAPPAWSVSMCEFAARQLAARLAAAGLATRRVGGYYIAARDFGSGGPGATPSLATTWDGIWRHWWIECEGFVVDVAADRFAGAATPAGRVVVIAKDAASAYQPRLPALEPRPRRSPAFSQ